MSDPFVRNVQSTVARQGLQEDQMQSGADLRGSNAGLRVEVGILWLVPAPHQDRGPAGRGLLPAARAAGDSAEMAGSRRILDNRFGVDYRGLGNISNARCDCPAPDPEIPGLLRLFPLPSLAKLSIDQELDRHIHEQ